METYTNRVTKLTIEEFSSMRNEYVWLSYMTSNKFEESEFSYQYKHDKFRAFYSKVEECFYYTKIGKFEEIDYMIEKTSWEEIKNIIS